MEGDPLCALRADTGQPAQLVDEVLNNPFVHGSSLLLASSVVFVVVVFVSSSSSPSSSAWSAAYGLGSYGRLGGSLVAVRGVSWFSCLGAVVRTVRAPVR